MSQNVLMGKDKKTTGKSTDRHKPRRMVGIRHQFAASLDALCERNGTDATEEVNRAIRELLIREELYPLKRS